MANRAIADVGGKADQNKSFLFSVFFFFFKFGACYIHRSVHWILLTRIERAGLSSRCGYMAAGPLCLLALRLFRAVFYGLTSDPPKTREEFVIKQPNSWDHHGNVFFSDHTRCFFFVFFSHFFRLSPMRVLRYRGTYHT